jgi:hypothetical protein
MPIVNQPLSHHLRQKVSDSWVALDLSLPGWAYPIADCTSRWVKVLLSMAENMHIARYQLEGQGPAGPLTAAYFGTGRSLGYLSHLLYEAPCQPQPAGKVMLPQLRQTVARLRADNDLIFVELPYTFLLGWSGQNGATTMPWLRQIVVINRRSWAQIEADFPKSQYRAEMRRLRREKFTYRISRAPADFDDFYYKMYLPYITQRFGPLTAVTPYNGLKCYFDRGWLLQVLAGQEVIAAELQYKRSDHLHVRSFGIVESETDWLKCGVSSAFYYFALKEAVQQGYYAVDLGLTRPFLSDGVLRYKSKWSPVVSYGSTLYQGLWIGAGGNGQAATEFFARHPLSWLDSAGHWHGLFVAPAAAPLTAADARLFVRDYWVPGLETMVFITPGGFSPDPSLEPIESPMPQLGPAVRVKVQHQDQEEA